MSRLAPENHSVIQNVVYHIVTICQGKYKSFGYWRLEIGGSSPTRSESSISSLGSLRTRIHAVTRLVCCRIGAVDCATSTRHGNSGQAFQRNWPMAAHSGRGVTDLRAGW